MLYSHPLKQFVTQNSFIFASATIDPYFRNGDPTTSNNAGKR